MYNNRLLIISNIFFLFLFLIASYNINTDVKWKQVSKSKVFCWSWVSLFPFSCYQLPWTKYYSWNRCKQYSFFVLLAVGHRQACSCEYSFTVRKVAFFLVVVYSLLLRWSHLLCTFYFFCKCGLLLPLPQHTVTFRNSVAFLLFVTVQVCQGGCLRFMAGFNESTKVGG